MSLKSQEIIAANQKKITIEVDRATFEKAINKTYKAASKNITIPGFRKGKAPRALVEKMYGKEVFYEDAINEIIRTGSKDTDTWREILRRHGWELWDLSEYEISEILRRIDNE